MPTYSYRCEACQHELEAKQKMSDAPLQTCPACGAAALKKQLNGANFHLKGSGWYKQSAKAPDAAPPPCASSGCCPAASGAGCATSE
ncbi:MAG: zinc ribbon domain-containing protein [Gammaproteobacteria bacterium]|nr:zinc ribbon domain-containing protein [Gammaproteobacteria bacterium]